MDIQLEINGQKVRVSGGATVMEAAEKLGVYIPHFCYHNKLSIAANCRMCLVQVEKTPKPMPACATPALEGMVVYTGSAAAKKAQQSVMEFLLINHPLDCPICDQGGECQLQDLAVGYGGSRSRYNEEKRVVFEKNLGPLISTDMTRCIHCTRCVRFGREIAGIMELGLVGRGEHSEIMPFVERTVESELSGNMIDVCPVGALTSKPFRYTARPWELTKKIAVAAHDSWGSNIMLHEKNGIIKRIVPAENEEINECWISDRDRFSYLGLSAPDRALSPYIVLDGRKKISESIWPEAISASIGGLRLALEKHGAGKIGFLASPQSSTEELFLLRKLAHGLGCENIDTRLRQRDFSSANDLVDFGANIDAIKNTGHILVIGAQPARELPLLGYYLRKRATRRLLLSSIGAVDMSRQTPVKTQIVARPSEWAGYLKSLLSAVENPQGALATVRDMASEMKKSKKGNMILLGADALGADNYGTLLDLVGALAQQLNCTVGTLAGGANSPGAKQAGARPGADGMNTAEMLRGDLRSFVLLNCEPADFAERAMFCEALKKAEQVTALVTHIDGVRSYADVIMPIAAAYETDGTFINGEGRGQSFIAAAKVPGEARCAWKVLRVMGEKLNLPDFNFSSLEDVRRMMEECPPPVGEVAVKEDSALASDVPEQKTGYDLVGGVAVYDTDMLIRRADALQKSAAGFAAKAAFMNPKDMAAAGISEGSTIGIGDNEEGRYETLVFGDTRLPTGALLAYPENLTTTTGLSVQAVPVAPLEAE